MCNFKVWTDAKYLFDEHIFSNWAYRKPKNRNLHVFACQFLILFGFAWGEATRDMTYYTTEAQMLSE